MNGIGASAKRAARCFIPITFLIVSGVAYAQSNASNIHPVIGDKPPKELLASDILALPEREQQAWIHGAVALTAQTVSMFDAEKGRCIINWYFYGNAHKTLRSLLIKHSTKPATSIVVAAAGSVCKVTYPTGEGKE